MSLFIILYENIYYFTDDSYNKMEEEMTCPVCLELYTDPIMLPCSHSLCKQCVNDIKLSTIRNREEGESHCLLVCPICFTPSYQVLLQL